MNTVGIKMLKEHLSEYVAIARSGERVIITDRGEEVAEIGPLSPERQAMKRLVSVGTVRWSGRKPRVERGPALQGETASDAVIEDRAVILYLDSSSLVKLYVEEAGSPVVRRWAEDAEVLATSRVAYTEVMAALARRQREGSLDTVAFQSAEARLAADWADFAVVDVNELAAGHLAVLHALRGFDAIHLAAALDLREEAIGVRMAFSSFDKGQVEAARAEGLVVLELET